MMKKRKIDKMDNAEKLLIYDFMIRAIDLHEFVDRIHETELNIVDVAKLIVEIDDSVNKGGKDD